MTENNLKEIHDRLVKIAWRAGGMIMAATPRTDTAGEKKNCKSAPDLTITKRPLEIPRPR
jgi:hypothetical protein